MMAGKDLSRINPMTAFEKIAEGLREVLSIARGETKPYRALTPNDETIKAMKDARASRLVKVGSDSIDDLLADLHKKDVLTILKACDAELLRLGVASLSLFGSVARNEDDEESDIDIAIKLDPSNTPRGFAYFWLINTIEHKLEKKLSRHVNVVHEPVNREALQNEIDRDRVVVF